MLTEKSPTLDAWQWIGIAAIWLYQVTLGLFIGGQCRFYPSCSRYTEQAVRSHGLGRGSYLGLRRLLRCHPFHPGGVDYVPADGCTGQAEKIV